MRKTICALLLVASLPLKAVENKDVDDLSYRQRCGMNKEVIFVKLYGTEATIIPRNKKGEQIDCSPVPLHIVLNPFYDPLNYR